jgi:hypothetical protein
MSSLGVRSEERTHSNAKANGVIKENVIGESAV